MLAVALETSHRSASVALAHGEQRTSAALEPERAHASDLLLRLEPLLSACGRGPADLQAVLVGSGPGSFTGLRVGIATALGLARGSGAQLQCVPSVEALAFGQLPVGEQGSVLLDARGDAFYLAHYGRTSEGIETLAAPRLVTRAELRSLLPEHGPILGDDSVGRAAELDPQQLARLHTGVRPHADHVLELGLARLRREGPLRPEQVQPLYLRPFVGRPRAR